MSDKKLTRYHTLNRSEAFGEISPPMEVPGGPAHSDQHGFLYDNDDNLIEAALTEEQQKKLRFLVAKAEADDEARKRRAEVLRKSGFTDDEVAADQADVDREDTTRRAKESNLRIADIDLKGWALGQVTYPFDKVRAKIRDQHGKLCTNFNDAIEFVGKTEGLPEGSLRKAA